MKLSNRDKFLIKEAFDAGFYDGCFANSEDWLAHVATTNGDTIEDQLAHEAAEIKED